MKTFFKQIIDNVEPLEDSIYGNRYRCAVTLNDGTFLPCVVLQSKQRIVELAKRRIEQELNGTGILSGSDPYGQIVASFTTAGNRVNDYEIANAEESIFSLPLSLMRQIHGETTMGWTGWVLEMNDGQLFSFGSSYSMEFFQLPDNYSFGDVTNVHNHSYTGKSNELSSLEQGSRLPTNYDTKQVYRERMYFTCAIDGI